VSAAPASPAPVMPVAAAERATPAVAPVAAAHERSAPAAIAGETSKASSGNDRPKPQSGKEPTTMASNEPSQGAFPGLQFSSGKEPIHITGNSMSFDQNRKFVLWTGRVHVNNGTSQITSDTLRVNYGQDLHDVREMIADGNVRISQGTRWATGDHAFLDQTKHTVTLTGSPVVHDGEDQIAGTKITVHLDTNQSDVENARAVIFPKESNKPSVDGAATSHGVSAAAQTPDRPPQVPPTIQGSPTEDNNP
jgi:lipopolysaccharide export system protein LptA